MRMPGYFQRRIDYIRDDWHRLGKLDAIMTALVLLIELVIYAALILAAIAFALFDMRVRPQFVASSLDGVSMDICEIVCDYDEE